MTKGQRWVSVGAVCALALAMLGCEKPLFPENSQRTPFERYMALRGQQRPATERDATGGSSPALRQRLRPLGQP